MDNKSNIEEGIFRKMLNTAVSSGDWKELLSFVEGTTAQQKLAISKMYIEAPGTAGIPFFEYMETLGVPSQNPGATKVDEAVLQGLQPIETTPIYERRFPKVVRSLLNKAVSSGEWKELLAFVEGTTAQQKLAISKMYIEAPGTPGIPFFEYMKQHQKDAAALKVVLAVFNGLQPAEQSRLQDTVLTFSSAGKPGDKKGAPDYKERQESVRSTSPTRKS